MAFLVMAEQAFGVNSITLSNFDVSSPRLIATCGGSLLLIWVLLGKVGLVLIGVACGVALHSWFEQFRDPTKLDEERGRRELGIEVVHRLINWQRPTVSSDGQSILATGASPAEFSDFRPSTAGALVTASDAIVQQYVE